MLSCALSSDSAFSCNASPSDLALSSSELPLSVSSTAFTVSGSASTLPVSVVSVFTTSVSEFNVSELPFSVSDLELSLSEPASDLLSTDFKVSAIATSLASIFLVFLGLCINSPVRASLASAALISASISSEV